MSDKQAKSKFQGVSPVHKIFGHSQYSICGSSSSLFNDESAPYGLFIVSNLW